MAKPTKEKPVARSLENASASDNGSTLLPMLIWGLVLATVGMIIVMLFV